MLFSFLAQPLTHGDVSFLDELVVYSLPVIVLLIVLTINRYRERKQPRLHHRPDRSRAAKASGPNPKDTR